MLALKQIWTMIIRERRIPQSIIRRGFKYGFCPVCNSPAIFIKRDNWLREHLLCVRCGSNPRSRAVLAALNEYFPNWHTLKIFEPSPFGAVSDKLSRKCIAYTPAYFQPNIDSGTIQDGKRFENIEKTSFGDDEFDLVISQDVMEHVLHMNEALKEIARILKPDGAHIFTVPWNKNAKTQLRAEQHEYGIKYLKEPLYHTNPLDKSDSLVTIDWGRDIFDIIYEASGMITTIFILSDPYRGLIGNSAEVFISQKHQIRN